MKIGDLVQVKFQDGRGTKVGKIVNIVVSRNVAIVKINHLVFVEINL
jgi:hypothetical protein